MAPMHDQNVHDHSRREDAEELDLEDAQPTDEDGAAEFDPTLYPRTYRMSLGWRLVILTCGALSALGGLFGAAYFSLAGEPSGWEAAFLIAVFTVFVCLGLYGVLHPLQYRVTLQANGVEVVEPFRRRRLSREEIKGMRLIHTGKGFSILALVPRDEHAKQVRIALAFKIDEAFASWVAEVPDLDSKEVVESYVELIRRLYPDLSSEERARRFKRLRQASMGVNGAAIALCAAGSLLPDPDHLVFTGLLALPWIAIVLVARFQPLYRFGGGSSNDRHLDLTAPLILPGFILTLRAVFHDIETLDWKGPAMLAFAGGLLLTGAAVQIDPWFRKQRWSVLLCGLMICLYGYGAGLELNAIADRSAPQVFQVVVLAKHASEDSRSTTWYLTLNPWGPVTTREDVSVLGALYRATRPGDTVCVLLRRGAIGMPWYEVTACREARVRGDNSRGPSEPVGAGIRPEVVGSRWPSAEWSG
jgi:hypothetical protein